MIVQGVGNQGERGSDVADNQARDMPVLLLIDLVIDFRNIGDSSRCERVDQVFSFECGPFAHEERPRLNLARIVGGKQDGRGRFHCSVRTRNQDTRMIE